MIKSIFCILMVLFSIDLMSAESDSSVVFKASFLKNEQQNYEISRAIYTIQKVDTISFERLRFKVSVLVKDSTENNYSLSWKFSNFAINTDNQQLRQLIALAKPVEINYRISKPGVLLDFFNGENVSTCLEEAMPKVLAQFANQKGQEAKTEVARIYEMRETLETLMLRAIHQFHQVYGLGYRLGEIVDVPTEVLSRFSAYPIRGVIRKKLTSIDRSNQCAVLSMVTYLDKNDFEKALKEYLHLDNLSSASLNQENMGSFVMDLSTGWVIWSFDQREVKSGNQVYGELLEIKHISETL